MPSGPLTDLEAGRDDTGGSGKATLVKGGAAVKRIPASGIVGKRK
jgi:hypothetical protein